MAMQSVSRLLIMGLRDEAICLSLSICNIYIAGGYNVCHINRFNLYNYYFIVKYNFGII